MSYFDSGQIPSITIAGLLPFNLQTLMTTVRAYLPLIVPILAILLASCSLPIRPPYESELPPTFVEQYPAGTQYRPFSDIVSTMRSSQVSTAVGKAFHDAYPNGHLPAAQLYICVALLPTGKVAASEVSDSSFRNAEFEKAMANVVRGVDFGPVKGDGYYLFAYPITTLLNTNVVELPKEYSQQLSQLVSSQVHYPKASQQIGRQGIALLRIDFSRDGTIIRCTIAQSAGDAALDAEARAAVYRVGKFPPVPPDADPSRTLFAEILPVTFSLQ